MFCFGWLISGLEGKGLSVVHTGLELSQCVPSVHAGLKEKGLGRAGSLLIILRVCLSTTKWMVEDVSGI